MLAIKIDGVYNFQLPLIPPGKLRRATSVGHVKAEDSDIFFVKMGIKFLFAHGLETIKANNV